MGNVDLSVIIPSKNNKTKTAEVIRSIADSVSELEVEFIVIDMNSTDNSVISALNEIKTRKLRGCVIQSGGSTVSSALNTGIYKSDGKYITFVYPNQLYKDYLRDYFNGIEENNADFIFSVPYSDKEKTDIVNRGLDHISGTDLIVGLVRSIVNVDFAAVMIRREYLLKNYIKFYDECDCGYAEAFVYNMLLFSPKIAYADIKLCRDYVDSMAKDDNASNNTCFDRIDAMLKVYDEILISHHDNQKLTDIFEYNKLPSVIMAAVDILLKENFSYSAIKNSLRLKHYDEYLRISRKTPSKLRKKIIKWKLIPWFYKP